MALSATFDDQLITTTDINDSSASNWDALYCSHLWSDSNLRREVINATYPDGKVIKYCYTCKGKIRKYEIRSPKQIFVPNNHSTPIPKVTIKDERSSNRPSNTSFRHTDNVSNSIETGQSIPTISHHIDSSFRHKYTTYEMRPHEMNRRRIRKSLKGIGCIVNLALIDSPVKKRTQIQACSISVMIIAIVVISFILVNFTTPSFTNPNEVTSTIVVPTMSSNETSSIINKYNKTIQSVTFNVTEQVAITETVVMISNSVSTETTNIEDSDDIHEESKLGVAIDLSETSTNLPPDFCSCQTSEICMLETTTGEGICRTPLDQDDPTGINMTSLIFLYIGI